MATSDSAARHIYASSGSLLRSCREAVSQYVTDRADLSATQKQPRGTLCLTADGAELIDHAAGQTVNPQPDLQTLLAKGPGRRLRKNLCLRLAQGRAVKKHIRLPASARDVLPAIVRNKVESLAPWPVEQAHWGYLITDELPGGDIGVDVGIISRQSASDLRSEIETAGGRVTRLEIADTATAKDAIVIDLDHAKRRQKISGSVKRAFTALAGICLLLAAYGLALVYVASTEISGITEQIARLQQAELNRGANTASPQLTAANRIHGRKKTEPAFAAVLADLTTAVPDGIWLESIEMRGERLVISGRGNDLAAMIGQLEESARFSNVQYAAAIQRDEAANVEIFTVSALIAKVSP